MLVIKATRGLAISTKCNDIKKLYIYHMPYGRNKARMHPYHTYFNELAQNKKRLSGSIYV